MEKQMALPPLKIQEVEHPLQIIMFTAYQFSQVMFFGGEIMP
jgi:hypothetical protein